MPPMKMRGIALNREDGFSLPELLVATGILLVITSGVTSGLLQITKAQKTIGNRVDLHAGIRSATELLQQEIGQAGRVALPYQTTLGAAVAAGGATVAINQLINGANTPSVAGLFDGELVVVDSGDLQRETVSITVNKATNQITLTAPSTFLYAHAAGVPVNVYGGFATGVVPPSAAPASYANGSDGFLLKLHGDVNGDGNMVYVEYKCDPQPPPGGSFYRTVSAFDSLPPKTVPGASQILLTNVLPNPDGSPCFKYQLPQTAVNGNWYVLDVAVTLTVQTQSIDPVTRQYQTETKALLNVSPRNVFDVWRLDAIGSGNRVQPIPTTVKNLLP